MNAGGDKADVKANGDSEQITTTPMDVKTDADIGKGREASTDAGAGVEAVESKKRGREDEGAEQVEAKRAKADEAAA